jgi:hypothetical protein
MPQDSDEDAHVRKAFDELHRAGGGPGVDDVDLLSQIDLADGGGVDQGRELGGDPGK